MKHVLLLGAGFSRNCAALIAARHAFYTTRLFHAIINILAMTPWRGN